MKLLLVLLISCAAFVAFAQRNKDKSKPEPAKPTTTTATTTTKSSGITFDGFKKSFNKTYKNREAEVQAEKNFRATKAQIDKHNSNPNKTYIQGVNSMSDRSADDMTKARIMSNETETEKYLKASKNAKNLLKSSANKALTKAMPATYDLTSEMTPIKDQGDCGLSWAFGPVATLEYKSKKEGKNLIFSEQSLLDCASTDQGCNVGNPFGSFVYVLVNGIALSSDYAYVAKQQKCKTFNSQAILTNACVYGSSTEDQMKLMLLKFGPLAVAIGTTQGFYNYKSGVYDDPQCPTSPNLNYVAVLVGYGTDPVQGDFWIIRSSFGTSWGQKGYGRMSRNKGNQCGIATFITAPCN